MQCIVIPTCKFQEILFPLSQAIIKQCIGYLSLFHTLQVDNLHFPTLNLYPAQLRMQFCSFAQFKKSENNYINPDLLLVYEL